MKKIIFDVDDTLYNMMDPFEGAFRKLFKERHRDTDLQKLFVLSRKYSDEVFEATVNGTMSMEEMYIYRIQQSCKDLGIKMTNEEALTFQGYYETNQGKIQMPETMQNILTMLKREEYTLGVITNGPSRHQRNKIEALGVTKWIPMEHIFISGDLDVAKPDPEIYRTVVRKMGGSPDEYLYIGDSFENDIVASKAAGWKAIWINRRDTTSEFDVKPDWTVRNDGELYELLRGEIER